jgi:hypothetical protein
MKKPAPAPLFFPARPLLPLLAAAALLAAGCASDKPAGKIESPKYEAESSKYDDIRKGLRRIDATPAQSQDDYGKSVQYQEATTVLKKHSTAVITGVMMVEGVQRVGADVTGDGKADVMLSPDTTARVNLVDTYTRQKGKSVSTSKLLKDFQLDRRLTNQYKQSDEYKNLFPKK